MSTEKCMPSVVLYGAFLDPSFYSFTTFIKGQQGDSKKKCKNHSIHFSWTQSENNSCCPFSSGELGCIWKCSEIKVNSWIQVPKGLCFFLKPNPSMFRSEDFYKMLLVCFPCPPVCHHCVSAWVLWGNQATLLLFVNVLIMFSVSTSYSGGSNHSEFIGLFWTCLSHYGWCTHNTFTLAPEEYTPKCSVLWDEQGLVWGRAVSFCSVIS